MYKCCITGNIVPRYTAAHKAILAVRPVIYKYMFAGRAGKGEARVVGHAKGWEIVKEGLVSPKALAKVPKLEDLLAAMESQEPIERTFFVKDKPNKKKVYSRRDTQVYRLRIIKKDGTATAK